MLEDFDPLDLEGSGWTGSTMRQGFRQILHSAPEHLIFPHDLYHFEKYHWNLLTGQIVEYARVIARRCLAGIKLALLIPLFPVQRPSYLSFFAACASWEQRRHTAGLSLHIFDMFWKILICLEGNEPYGLGKPHMHDCSIVGR